MTVNRVSLIHNTIPISTDKQKNVDASVKHSILCSLSHTTHPNFTAIPLSDFARASIDARNF